MMQNQSRGFSWAFKHAFHFGSNGSMEQVVRSLMLLGDEGFFGLTEQ